MKRKILLWIKQKLCRHRYEFVECDCTRSIGYFPSWYFLYRCKKCEKYKIIYCHSIEKELECVIPEKVLEYPKDVLWIPKSYENELIPQKFYSREAGYLVSEYYNKYGILLTAWGNLEFGHEVDRDNLDIESNDEPVSDTDRVDTLTLEESQFIICRQEFKQSMERF